MSVFVPILWLSLLLAALVVERVLVRRSRDGLTVVVHVGGTRGKTSITRYIAAGLRAAGLRVCAKVTGSHALRIGLDGRVEGIKRRGSPRVQEQFRILRWAARQGAEGLVIECMSIDPEFQRVESRHLKPHLFVLARVRDDHREHLGDPDAQIAAMCEAIPSHAAVLTDDSRHIEAIGRAATERGSRVVALSASDLNGIGDVPEGAHRENVALALRACLEVGAERERALAGILDEATQRTEGSRAVPLRNGRSWFVDGFAVNDVESAGNFLDVWRARLGPVDGLVVLLNTRSDRPLRSGTFAEWLPQVRGLNRVILMGDHTPWTRRALKRYGMADELITVWKDSQVRSPRDALEDVVRDRFLVAGLGNTHGSGLTVVSALEGRDQSHV